MCGYAFCPYLNKDGSPSFVIELFRVVLAEAYNIRYNTLLLHVNIKITLQKSDSVTTELLLLLEVTPCMLLHRVKIGNFLLTFMFEIYSFWIIVLASSEY